MTVKAWIRILFFICQWLYECVSEKGRERERERERERDTGKCDLSLREGDCVRESVREKESGGLKCAWMCVFGFDRAMYDISVCLRVCERVCVCVWC